MTTDPFIGYRRLKPGRIHLYCPKCKRKVSNAQRSEHDPPNAHLLHYPCDKCSMGDKVDMNDYMDAEGRWLDWQTGEPQ